MAERDDPTSPPPGFRVVVAVAVGLVLYSYLGALWLNRHGYSPITLERMRAWVNKPSGIGEDFGVLGLAMLLIVAGYGVAAGLTRSVGPALTRFACLAGPAVLVATSVSAAVRVLGGDPLTEPAGADLTPAGYLANLVLVDRLADQPSLVATAWPVPVTALAGLVMLSTLPVLRRFPLAAVFGQLVLLGALVLLCGHTGPRELGMLAGFAALPVLGELIWLVRSGRVGAWPAGLAGIGAAAVLTLTDRLYREWDGWWYPVTALYALLFVLLGLRSGAVLGRTAVVRWSCDRALWLVLCCAAVGYPVLGVQYLRVPVPLALAVGLAVTLLAAEAGHRWLQRPLVGLVRGRGMAEVSR